MGEKRKAQSQHSVRPSFLPSPCSPVQSLWRAQPSCGRLTSWCVSLLPVSSHSSRYSTHIFQTCLRPCSSQELTLTVATATGKLCCWMTQFLNSHILHSQWFAVFASKKSTKGQCPLCHLPKMWARRQRTRLGGRARQVKHRLQFCFVFVSQVLSGNWMLVCISGP